MDSPPPGGERVRVLALALVLHAETVAKIRRLAMPRYGKMTRDDLYNRIDAILRLCDGLRVEIEEGTAMPSAYNTIKPLEGKFWTAQGKNERDDPMNVGIFGSKPECHRWCDRQNETQHQQAWGRGSAGPMVWKPTPIYGSGNGIGAPDPVVPIFPERLWEEKPDARDL